MANGTRLLNDDGSASMATMIMMWHHGFRRDLARFEIALGKVARGDPSRCDALREEWQNSRGALHGHHQVEDTSIFPDLQSTHGSLGPVLERLGADHRRIDPLLERGDRAFAELPKTEAANAVVAELETLLDAHFTLEEAEAIPFLRDAKEFLHPVSDADVDLYAQGFAWASHGVAAEVRELVYAMLPASLRSRLPAARAAFALRCERVWGTASAGASRTSLPDR